jgi:hypothetical protein
MNRTIEMAFSADGYLTLSGSALHAVSEPTYLDETTRRDTLSRTRPVHSAYYQLQQSAPYCLWRIAVSQREGSICDQRNLDRRRIVQSSA